MLYIICKENKINKPKITHTWHEIIEYVNNNNVQLMIVDIDGVILSEKSDNLTEQSLKDEFKKLQNNGITIICLTARPNNVKNRNGYNMNNGSYTLKQLNQYGIYPNEVRFTNRQPKGLFVKNLLIEYKNKNMSDYSVFIDNDQDQTTNACSINNIQVFLYTGDN